MGSNPTLSAIQITSARKGGGYLYKRGGIRTEGSWQGSGGALQPEAARPQAGNPTLSAIQITSARKDGGYLHKRGGIRTEGSWQQSGSDVDIFEQYIFYPYQNTDPLFDGSVFERLRFTEGLTSYLYIVCRQLNITQQWLKACQKRIHLPRTTANEACGIE